MAKKPTEPETAAETTAENTPDISDKTETKPQKRIYAGASVPGMEQNTVFEGDIPTVLDVPFVRDLCMDITEYGRFAKERLDSSSRAAFCYNKSVELAEKLAAEKNN